MRSPEATSKWNLANTIKAQNNFIKVNQQSYFKFWGGGGGGGGAVADLGGVLWVLQHPPAESMVKKS